MISLSLRIVSVDTEDCNTLVVNIEDSLLGRVILRLKPECDMTKYHVGQLLPYTELRDKIVSTDVVAALGGF